MWQYQNTNELYHFGVPGMKWKNRKSKHQPHPDHLEAKRIKKMKMKERSNADLQKYNNRKNLERNHKQLNPNKVAAAMATVATASAILASYNDAKRIIPAIAKEGKKITSSALKYASKFK